MISQEPRKYNRNNILCYNELNFRGRLLTYFLIRLIIRHETQSKRFKNPLYRQQPHSLRWPLSYAEFFSENKSPLPSQSKSSPLSKEQPVQYCGRNFTLLYRIILGLGRIETFHLLKHNGVFQYLTGLPAYPNPTTLRRFLLRMAPGALGRLRKLHEKILSLMNQKPRLAKRSFSI